MKKRGDLSTCKSFRSTTVLLNSTDGSMVNFAEHTSTLVGGYVYILGGRGLGDAAPYNAFVHKLELGMRRWTRTGVRIPSELKRRHHGAFLAQDTIYIYGGQTGVALDLHSDLWAFELVSNEFQHCQTYGDAPLPLLDISLSFFEYTNEAILFGGEPAAMDFSSQLFALNLDSKQWRRPITRGKPPQPRSAHASCTHNDSLFIFGGYGSGGQLGDLHILKAQKSFYVWSQPITRGRLPTPRHDSTINYCNGRLIVFGGVSVEGASSELSVFDLPSNRWYKSEYLSDEPNSEENTSIYTLQVAGKALRRNAHTSVYFRNKLFVIGGDLMPLNTCTIFEPMPPVR